MYFHVTSLTTKLYTKKFKAVLGNLFYSATFVVPKHVIFFCYYCFPEWFAVMAGMRVNENNESEQKGELVNWLVVFTTRCQLGVVKEP